jgi:hypothetical protein
MRFVYPLFMLVLLMLIATTWFSLNVYSDPKITAVKFMEAVRAGDLVKAVKLFGSNACRCPAKGGWVSYLIYRSGQEQNFAFLVGHPFQIGPTKVTPMKNEKQALLPWQKPEDCAVDVPITFDAKNYMPYFLPLKMAYGQDMTEGEFNNFVEDPDKDSWKGFTLRLRPGIEAGAIVPPTVKIPEDLVDQFRALTDNSNVDNGHARAASGRKSESNSNSNENASTASDITVNDIKKALGENATTYLTPRDAGSVVAENGKTISVSSVTAKLPRLKSAVARLHVVRRGKLNDWTIYHIAVIYPVVHLSNGQDLELKEYARPK